MARGSWVARNFWLLTAGVLAVCLAATAMAEEAHFQRMSGCPYTVGSQPYCAIADVNGDGKGDVVTSNLKDNTITIMLANDSGGLTEASNSPLDPGVTLSSMYADRMRIAPVFGDIDADGDQDMVLDCAEGVALLLNDGSGGFAHADGSPFSTGMQELYDKWKDNWYVSIWIPDPTKYGHPSFSTVMDMNGDGYEDVVARTGGGYYITVLLGDKDGKLTVADGYPLDLVRANVKDSNGDPAYPPELDAVAIGGGYCVRCHGLGDFNGDGVPDYVVSRGMMVGTGGGKFTVGPQFEYPGISSPSSGPNWMAVIDLNNDHHDDFMWGQTDGKSDQNGGPPYVMFESDGAGGYSWDYGPQSRGLPVVADVNGDGNDDLVGVWGLFSGYPYGLYVSYGDGQGNFTQAPWAPLCVWGWEDFYYQSKSINVGDVNGDGKPDIAVSFGIVDSWNPSGSYDKKLDVFINTKTGDFKPVLQPPFLAGGRLSQPFRYRIAAKGTTPITFAAEPLPAGLTLSDDTITGTPTKEGQTEVTLTATNGAGSDSAVLTITISDGTNQSPEITAGPGAAPNPAIMNKPVNFSVTATDPDNDTLSYAWSFGDGGTGNGAGPTHTYAEPGTYQVIVTVTDGVGGSAWGGVSVEVQEFGGLGDLNGDKVVNVDDVTLVISHHGETSDNPNWDARADANGDGKVDDADLLIVIENFGRIYG